MSEAYRLFAENLQPVQPAEFGALHAGKRVKAQVLDQNDKN
jgi:hypothetical protein